MRFVYACCAGAPLCVDNSSITMAFCCFYLFLYVFLRRCFVFGLFRLGSFLVIFWLGFFTCFDLYLACEMLDRVISVCFRRRHGAMELRVSVQSLVQQLVHEQAKATVNLQVSLLNKPKPQSICRLVY